MDFNTFLFRFGLEPSNFKNKEVSVIETKDGFIYELEEQPQFISCKECGSVHVTIHDYNWVEIKSSQSNDMKEILRIKRVRYKCCDCKKSFTLSLKGINRYSKITQITKNHIYNDFQSLLTFTDIGKKYGLSTARIIQLFDEMVPIIPRLRMPEVLCIDELHFEGDTDGKYIVVLSNYFTGEVVDVVQNRQMPYLREYFNNISISERINTKVFISDMYDGYSTICRQFFPKAIHIVDIFHVITQLTNVVNKLRIRTMNQFISEKTKEKNFMKQHWKLFLCKDNKIPNKMYHYIKDDQYYSYHELLISCLKLNMKLWDSYTILQELFKYSYYNTYEESIKFTERIIHKLEMSCDDLLDSVARTYKKWKIEIANGFASNQHGKRFTNAIAENNNTHIRRILKSAYGFHNFERTRKKILLNRTYKK